MRAAVLERPGDVRVLSVEVDPHAAGEALVGVRSVGICGTDLSIARGHIPVAYPRILGHEIVGELLDPGATTFDAGTTVLVDPGLSCGSCAQCREGRTNICTRGGLLGRDSDGGLRETMPVRSMHVYAVPTAIDVTLAPIVQVLATCVHAQQLIPINPGERVAVIGLGVTGLLHVQLAAQRGATVVGITRSHEKLSLADSLGADVTVPADGDEVHAVTEAVGDVDVVIECAGTVPTLATSIELVRVGGRILSYGTIGRGAAGALPYYDVYYKELSIVGARSARAEDFGISLDLVAAGTIRLDALVSERFPLDEVSQAFEVAGATGALKVMIDV